MLTLSESQSFSDKNVVAFCTSGSSGIEGSLEELATALAGASIEGYKRFAADASDAEIQAFV